MFRQLNAVTAGVKDIKDIVEETSNEFLNPSGRCVLFIDEIHRFNKSQQDALLPYVENGLIVLIGATTENPFLRLIKLLFQDSQCLCETINRTKYYNYNTECSW